MVIIKDEARFARMALISKIVSFVGIGALIFGFIIAVTGLSGDSPLAPLIGGPQNLLVAQLAALGLGLLCSQIGTYLAVRYVRSPRPDEVIDKALGRVAKNGRLYHYVLPVPHVLLSDYGVIILVNKYQGGDISVENDKWRQSGLGMRRFFGQENLGNPTREAEQSINVLANFIRKNAPTVEELPIGAVIVFTYAPPKTLELSGSRIPAMHHTKVKSYLRRKRRSQPLSPEVYDALQAAFDAKAQHILQTEHDAQFES